MDARCPRAWAGVLLLRDTERLDRDLDRPARVLDVREALQGEPGPGGRGTFIADER